MRCRTVISPPVSALIHHQGGAVTRSQLESMGLTRHGVASLVASGQLVSIHAGVYCAGHPTWLEHAWAGVVIAGPGACVGGMAAAHLYGMTNESERIGVWCPRHRPRVSSPSWRFRQGFRVGVGEPRRTRIEDTLIDLCAGQDAGTMSSWLGKALAERLTTPQRIERALDDAPTMAGRRLFRELLGQQREVPIVRLSRGTCAMSSASTVCPKAYVRNRCEEGLVVTSFMRDTGSLSSWMDNAGTWGWDNAMMAGVMRAI